MSTPITGEQAIRDRIRAVVERILGHPLEPGADELTDLDSLQVLELMVSLEEEFDIDSDRIIETQTDWWTSLDGLVASVGRLSDPATKQA
ncbi:acyl carrier protein [Catellatospora methionotrophica]|uniref:acyl carrier protein n=1 Tax=Catellatospora methionotrophica TaxID=121620 RepID=UPI0033C6A552